MVTNFADVRLRYIGTGMGTTDVEREYSELLAQERAAWATLRQNMQGGEYDPALLAEWLAIGRKCEVARQRMIDAVLQDDPGVMHRPMPRA
jgi:hypothetical protein